MRHVVSLALLVIAATLLISFASRSVTLIGQLVLLDASLFVLLSARHQMRGVSTPAAWRRRIAPRLVQQLGPFVVVAAAYVVAGPRLAGSLGGVPVGHVLLAVSLVTPWIAHASAFPLYTELGRCAYRENRRSASEQTLALVTEWFAARWARAAVWALLPVAGVSLLLLSLTGWSLGGVAAFGVSTWLHVLFLQTAVPIMLVRRSDLWARLWVGYALGVAVAPDLAWVLAPLGGLLTAAVSLGRPLTRLGRTGVPQHGTELMLGLAGGAVMWADKFVWFAHDPAGFHGTLAFLAMLPSVLLFNTFFVVLDPPMERELGSLKTAMENVPIHRYGAERDRSYGTVVSVSVQLAAAAAAVSMFTALVVVLSDVAGARQYALLSIGAWPLVTASLLGYRLMAYGRRDVMAWHGAGQLLALAVWLLPATPDRGRLIAYIVSSLLLLTPLVRCSLRSWRRPEYAAFWRHATAW